MMGKNDGPAIHERKDAGAGRDEKKKKWVLKYLPRHSRITPTLIEKARRIPSREYAYMRDSVVRKAYNMARAVAGDAHRTVGFLRFHSCHQNLLWARCSPRHRVEDIALLYLINRFSRGTTLVLFSPRGTFASRHPDGEGTVRVMRLSRVVYDSVRAVDTRSSGRCVAEVDGSGDGSGGFENAGRLPGEIVKVFEEIMEHFGACGGGSGGEMGRREVKNMGDETAVWETYYVSQINMSTRSSLFHRLMPDYYLDNFPDLWVEKTAGIKRLDEFLE